MEVKISIDSSFKIIYNTVRYEQLLVHPYTTMFCGFSIESLISPDEIHTMIDCMIANKDKDISLQFSPEMMQKIKIIVNLSSEFIEHVPKIVNEIVCEIKSNKLSYCSECDDLSFPYILSIDSILYKCECRDITINLSEKNTFIIGDCEPVNVDLDEDKIIDHIDEVLMALYCKLHKFIDVARST